MGFKPTRAALCLCVAAVCVSGVSSSITEPSKDRVLQGSYTPAQDSDEQIYCSAAGLSFSSLVLPEASLPDLRLKLENPLTGVATQFIDLILSAELRGQIGVRAPKLIMSVPVIGWSIFIVCLIVFLLFALFFAWFFGFFQ